MNQHTGLVTIDRPRAQILMVIDPTPIRASLPEKPTWMQVDEWVGMLVWLVMVTNPREDLETSWYRLIDYAYQVLRESLSRKRIINLDVETEAREALPKVANTYKWLCPVLYPVLQTVYPQIREGYRIRFDQLTREGCWLTLTLP